MKTLTVSFSKEGLNLSDDIKDLSPQGLFLNVFKNIIFFFSLPTKGLKEDDRRLYYKIYDVLEKAVEDSSETVDLEDNWLGFMRKCKREASITPDKLLRKVENLIDEAKDK